MTPQEYTDFCVRICNSGISREMRMACCALGLVGEAQESFIAPYSKRAEELGDVLFYFSVIRHDLGLAAIWPAHLKVSQGLLGCAAEFADELKKHLMQGHSTLKVCVKLTAVEAALAYCIEYTGSLPEEIARGNHTKLMKRYPEGFSIDRSVNREGA